MERGLTIDPAKNRFARDRSEFNHTQRQHHLFGHLLEFITTVNDGYLDIYNFAPNIQGLTSTNPSGGGLPNGVLCDNCIVEMGESTISNDHTGWTE